MHLFPSGIPLSYQLPESFDDDQFVHRFSSLGSWVEEEPVTTLLTYYDTFDWRLYAAGTVLCGESTDGWSRMLWYRLDRREVLGQQPGEVPRFARDLPEGVLRNRIAPILEMRALFPLARLHRRRRLLALLDHRQKTVLRVGLDRFRIEGAEGGEGLPGPLVLSIEPLKGYPAPVKRLIAHLEQEDLIQGLFDPVHLAVSALGLQPGSTSSKLDLDLDPVMPAREALRRILLHLVRTIRTNEDGTRQDLDTEFLHDFRVAVRRTRSALGQLKGVFPVDLLERMRAEFAWLGQVTTPTRDLDVYLLTFPSYRESLPPEVREDLAPLHDFLHRHQHREQRLLARRLTSARYRRLVEEWQAWLENPTGPWGSDAEVPIGVLAGKRIHKAFRRVLREGEAITENSPAEELHELRKSCKKLRYLLEFFQSLYPPGEVRTLIRALKGLQDNLGAFQDLSVQAETLRGFAHKMTADGQAPAETLLAMGILVDHLRRRGLQSRAEFAERFTAFSRPRNRSLFEKLFLTGEN